jgi:tetratricopeptide (TPR) repeat protein
MRIAHLDKSRQGTLLELLESGRKLEADKDYNDAVKIYAGILKKNPLNEQAYNRLMIVYRKQKDYRSESAIIDEAIKNFEKEGEASKKPVHNKVHQLSMSLGKSTGLVDKKGKSLYEPEPIATWKKRKAMVLKHLKTKKK